MAERKLSNRERIKEITAGIEQGIKELFESEKYKKYLTTMSRFPSYSLNNTLLIHMQMPDATLVAGYGRWQKQFERHVKKGERGITIIAPTPYRKKIEEQKLDPETKAPLLDKDGKVITEEKEINISMYKPVKVFDVSQTEGKPLPQLASDLTGDVRQFDAFMEALRRASPVPIRFEKMDEKMDGYFNYESQSIAIREGMSEVQTVSAAVHEMAHAILHNYEKQRQEASAGMEGKEPPKQKDRRTEEVEAESVSFAVCAFYNIDTGANSFGYLASWSKGKELAELKASLETINKTAGSLIKSIDGHFKEICRERGIDLSVKDPTEKDPVVEFAAELDQLFYDYDTYGYQDSVESREDGIDQIVQSVLKKDVKAISNWLADVIEEADEEYAPKAKELSERLDALVSGKERPEVSAEQKSGEKEADIPAEEERKTEEADISEEQVDGAEKKDVAIEQKPEAKESDSLAGRESEPQKPEMLTDQESAAPKPETLEVPEAAIQGDLSDRIKDALYSQVSSEEAAFSINQGKQYLAIQTCADGYDYTFFNADFEGMDGGQLDRPEIPMSVAAWILLSEEYLEDVEVEPFDFDTLMEQGELMEQKCVAAAQAKEIVQGILVQYGLQDEVKITGLEVYRNLYGESAPLRYDILVGYEGNMKEEDLYDILQETNHSIGGNFAHFIPITPEESGTMEEHAAWLMEKYGDGAVQIDALELPKQKLDEYPLPDTGLRMEDLETAGYRDGDMLPISKDRAGELFDKDLTVYSIVGDGSAEMIFEKEEMDLPESGSLFAVSKEDWEESTDFHAEIMERQEHQEEREQAFLSYEGDCFAIYQVREDTADRIRFMGLDWLKEKGIPVERANYDLIYTGELTATGDTGQRLESLYEQFNIHHPADYHSPSLSVSDIIAVKQSGVLSCHYCDRIGFQEIPGFLPGENYLKAAEMAVEDDYGMIDGIINNGPKELPTVAELEQQAKSGQPISLMDLADAVHREQAGKKKSVVEQLKSRPDQRQKKVTQKQRDGREI